MKRILLLLLIVLVGGFAVADEHGEDAERMEDEDVILADVVEQLENINDRLSRITGEDDEEYEMRAPDVGGGGSQFYPFRYFLEMGTLNSYLAGVGAFTRDDGTAGYSEFMFPMLDSGGGTWRWSFSRNFQVGFDFWSGGYTNLGQLTHQTAANAANDTVDEDGDGLDDYYSYANWGLGMGSLVVAGKLEPVEDVLFLTGAARVGMAGESFTVERSRRDVLETTVAIVTGDVEWSRSLLQLGGALGVQIALDDANVVRLGIEGGFDYFVPIGDWKPSAGVHTATTTPPDWNPMNAWVRIGPHFRY